MLMSMLQVLKYVYLKEKKIIPSNSVQSAAIVEEYFHSLQFYPFKYVSLFEVGESLTVTKGK